MDFQLPELPADISGVTYGLVGFVAAIAVIAKLSRGPNLDAFPTVGSSSWLGSWWAGFKYLMNTQNLIRAGYEKHKSAPFKIAEPSHWTVIISNRRCLEELARASDDKFSFSEAANDKFHVEDTLGREIHHNQYHLNAVIRSNLTRNIDALYPEIRDEVVKSFAEVLDLRGNEWKSVLALCAIQKVVCRTSNRVFVGLPLCRNPDWIDLNIRYAVDVIKGGIIVGLFPKFMRPQAVRFLTKIPQSTTSGAELLSPIIEERLKYLNEYGTEWDDKPNDFLSWLIEAEGPELTAERLTTRVLAVNFVAIHTTSNSFTQALFYLAANPQYIQPLREEVEGVVEKDGWSKAALGKMRKVDSFLKECQRIEGGNIVTLSRKALKGFTFSDGTFVPKGTHIAAATSCLHYDESFYRNPEVFKPFRFAHMREEAGKDLRHQLASTTTEYLAFGHGRHACPGRFFAATELKSMLAHMVVTYDVKLEDNATCPPSLHFSTFIAANPHGKVVFRHRVA